ncbi:hypothetical protein TNCV_2165871 [Trichonephila clavipes]|nr:hypothetical protein TNCV_2165871 [Trichonephila clavipes]
MEHNTDTLALPAAGHLIAIYAQVASSVTVPPLPFLRLRVNRIFSYSLMSSMTALLPSCLSPSEVEVVFRKLRVGKAPGIDLIDYAI